MNRAYWLVPFLGMSAFTAYYLHWTTTDLSPSFEARYAWDANDPFARRAGAREAENDLRDGRLALLTYGLPSPWGCEFGRILREEYGIEYHAVAGCLVTTAQQEYVASYNTVMESAVARIHGPNFLEEIGARILSRPVSSQTGS